MRLRRRKPKALQAYVVHNPYANTTNATVTTSANVATMVNWTYTYYQPSRMKLADRLMFAVDEWQHRHSRYAGLPRFPWIWWRHPLGSLWYWAWRPLCSHWDKRLWEGRLDQ